jgi:hypothetical protein
MSAPKDRANEPSRRYVAKGIDRLEEESNKVYLAEEATKKSGKLISPHNCLQCGAGDHKTEEC